MSAYDRHLLAVRHESAALASAAARDLSAVVASCPGWTVAELVTHVGAGARAIARTVRDHADAEPSFAPPAVAPGDLLAWYDEGVAELVEALANETSDAPAWNWSGRDETVAFWARRVAHEIAVHRWDAEAAVGTPSPVEADLASDGVDEALTVFLPYGLGKRPREGLAGTFVVEAVDTGDTWFGRVLPDTADVVRGGAAETPDAVLRGTASDLVLAIWGRPLPITAEGDARIVGVLTE